MKKLIAILISLLFVGSTFGIGAVFGKSGGPDAFGYTYDDTVPYQWIEISEIGTNTGLHIDDRQNKFPIGFNFKYYGNTYNEVSISTNGFLTFSGTGDEWSSCSNQNIPNTDSPNNIICCFWDDLYPPTAGNIYYKSFSDKFIVQWDDIPHISDRVTPRSSMTFQIILYRDSNAIKFQYKEMKNGTQNYDYAGGRSATVGLENIDGTVGLKYYYGDDPTAPLPPIKNGLAIGFKYPGTNPPWAHVGQLPIAQILKILKENKDK